MIAQLDNKIVSSFLLLVDHVMQSTGQAFYNTTGTFYSTPSNIAGLYVYSSPFKSLCNDVSVTGATVMSGVYLNGNYVSIGQSGLQGINHYEGTLYFSSQLPASTRITGSFGVKEFSVQIADKPEWKLLFETKYVSNNGFSNGISLPSTGLGLEVKTSPILMIRAKMQNTKPFAVGGLDDSKIRLRTIVIADSEYQKLAATNVLKNFNYRFLPIITSVPFSSVGTLTGTNQYDYNALTVDSVYQPTILSVNVIEIPIGGEYRNINRNMALVDYEISTIISHW